MSNSRSIKSWLKNNRNYTLLIFNNFVSTSTRHSLVPNLNWIKIVSILKLHMYFPMKNLIYTKREIEFFNEMECKIDNLFSFSFFKFLIKSFNQWYPFLMITLYNQIKTPIGFSCRRGLNPRSLIQPSETLLTEPLN